MRCTRSVLVCMVLFAVVSLTAGCAGGGGGGSAALSNPGSGGAFAGSASLAWDAPSANTNGTSLTDLRGYKVHYGPSPGSYTQTVDAGDVTAFTLQNLAPGTYYITVTAYNSAGAESSFSNEVSKTIL